MSRVGKKAIPLPSSVKINQTDGVVTVEGPKGKLTHRMNDGVKLDVADGVATVVLESEDHAMHGMTRALIANMVKGVTEEFVRNLDIVGMGYRAAVNGGKLELQLGYSHPITVTPPTGITITSENPTRITVRGIDKQLVGQVAANIRAYRKPEPYKGKGIRYEGEQVRRKAGKSAGS